MCGSHEKMELKYIEKLYGKKFLDKQKDLLDKMPEKKWLPLLLAGEDEGSQIFRKQFDKYLELAYRHGIVDKNLQQRLKSSDWKIFQQTHQEIMCAYFFEQEFAFDIQFFPSGQGVSVLDFLATTSANEKIHVEVKTVFIERPTGVWLGDDREPIKKNVKRARRQLSSDENIVNLVIISGHLRDSLSSPASGIVEALYGEPYITFSIGPNIEGTDYQDRLNPSGEFQPTANTRISAVATLEDVIQSPYLDSIFNHVVSNRTIPYDDTLPRHIFHFIYRVYHNPYAKNPLDRSIFSNHPQFIHNANLNRMEWLNK
jgi:hypothetical protein